VVRKVDEKQRMITRHYDILTRHPEYHNTLQEPDRGKMTVVHSTFTLTIAMCLVVPAKAVHVQSGLQWWS